jgi:hypothetical protein
VARLDPPFVVEEAWMWAWPAKIQRERKTSGSGEAGGYPVVDLMQIPTQITNTKTEEMHMYDMLSRIIYGGLVAFDTELKEWLP